MGIERDLYTMQQVYLANRETPRATRDLARVVALHEYVEQHDLAKEVESDMRWRGEAE